MKLVLVIVALHLCACATNTVCRPGSVVHAPVYHCELASEKGEAPEEKQVSDPEELDEAQDGETSGDSEDSAEDVADEEPSGLQDEGEEQGPQEAPPQPKLAKVVEGRIQTARKIHFMVGKPQVVKESEEVLDDVAKVLKAHPEITTLRIEGYTDSRGRKAYNVRLSRQRALAVKKYLVNKGISAKRLVAKGYGPARPIADNSSKEGRAANRRVELVIIE